MLRKELPAEGLSKVEIKLWQGNLIIRSASAGAAGVVESDGDLDVKIDGNVLHCKQTGSLAALIGEQQVRIAIDGNVLYDKQLRFGGRNIELVLPASVRELRCRTGKGDIRLEGVDCDVDISSYKSDVWVIGTPCPPASSHLQQKIRFASHEGNVEVDCMHGDLQVKTGKGYVKVDEAHGRIEMRTGNGNFVAGQLSGEASIHTGCGDIVATSLDGAKLEVRTGRGAIAVGGGAVGLKCVTRSGEIICQGKLTEGVHDLHTGSGNVELDLTEGSDVQVDASTRYGKIRSNLSLVKVGTPGPGGYFGQRLVGSVGSTTPKATVNLRTDRGDIRVFVGDGEDGTKGDVTQSRMGATSAGIDPQVVRDDGYEKTILEAVSCGELSVDDALKLLDKSL